MLQTVWSEEKVGRTSPQDLSALSISVSYQVRNKTQWHMLFWESNPLHTAILLSGLQHVIPSEVLSSFTLKQL